VTPGTQAAREPVSRAPLRLWLLPLVVWLVATLFFAGDLGHWSDDYGFLNLDQSTGAYERLAPPLGDTFWRPLHLKLTYALGSLLWFQPRVVHLLLALAHGLVSVLLWRVLRALGRSPAASALAALLFLLAPVHYEVVFWRSALSIGVATGIVLALFLIQIALVRGAVPLPCLAMLALGGFAVPCFNEQPAAALAALPAIGCAALPPDRTLRDGAGRIAAGTLAAVLGPVLYLGLFLTTATASYRGAPGTWPALGRLPEQGLAIAADVWRAFAQGGFRAGAWTQGVTEIAAHPLRAGVLALLLVVATLPWLARVRSASSWRVDCAHDGAARHTCATLLFGVLVFVLTWLPLLAVPGQMVPPRLAYAPLVGVAIVAATLLDALVARAGHGRLAPVLLPAVCTTAALVVAYALVLMVGVQALFFHRARADERLTRELVRALPDPPLGALLLPLRDEGRPVTTGFTEYDHALPGPFGFTWSAPTFVRWAYRRIDLFATGRPPWVGALTRGGDASAAYVIDPGMAPTDFPRGEDGLYRVPWGRLVPLVIEPDQTVRLVTRVVVRDADGRERIVPSAADAARATGAPDLEMPLP